jgi:hypothetical protein
MPKRDKVTGEWRKLHIEKHNYDYIYIYIYNCNWVDTRWQQYSAHLHTNNTQNTENGTYTTITKLNIHNIHTSVFIRLIKSRRMRWEWRVVRMGEKRDVYRVLGGKPVGKRPLGRPRHNWEDNMKMNLKEVGCGAWTGLIWLGIVTGGRHL